MGKWWATLESNQAWVSPADLQSAAAPCSSSPVTRPGDEPGANVRASLNAAPGRVNRKIPSLLRPALPGVRRTAKGDHGMAKKPDWVIRKEQAARQRGHEEVWLFGLHAVRDALLNPRREKLRLIVTPNAEAKLADAIAASGIAPEVSDPRKFAAPLDSASVHQGAALAVHPLDWGPLPEIAVPDSDAPARVLLLDRVSDPHNVGAILRSAEVFGARAVIGTLHHSAPETGALAKTASGALERQPYLRETNLSRAMTQLKDAGYTLIGLDGEADRTLDEAIAPIRDRPIGLVLGAEGPGLRPKTKDTCDILARIDAAGAFGSLNVSNAAAVALYAATRG